MGKIIDGFFKLVFLEQHEKRQLLKICLGVVIVLAILAVLNFLLTTNDGLSSLQ